MKTEKQILTKIKNCEIKKQECDNLRNFYRYKNHDKSILYYDLYMNEYYKIMILKWVLK